MPSLSSYERLEEFWEWRYNVHQWERELAKEDGGDGGTDEEEEEEEEREGVPRRARVSGVAVAAGAACPVCMDPCACQGPHRISCIPCGHVYGRSCLKKWLTKSGNQNAMCPLCGKRFKQKDIINLYAQDVAIPNTQPEKVVRHDKMFEEMTKGHTPNSPRVDRSPPAMPSASIAKRLADYWVLDALASDESIDFSVLTTVIDCLGTLEGAPETTGERVALRCLQQLSSKIPAGGDAAATAGVPRFDGALSCQDVLFRLTTEVQVGSSGKLDIREAICSTKLTLQTFIHQLKKEDLEKMELDVVEAEGRPLKRLKGT